MKFSPFELEKSRCPMVYERGRLYAKNAKKPMIGLWRRIMLRVIAIRPVIEIPSIERIFDKNCIITIVNRAKNEYTQGILSNI